MHKRRNLVPVLMLACFALVGCGDDQQPLTDGPFIDAMDPIVSDICDLKQVLECDRFNDTVEDCRIEMLTTLDGRHRFNEGDEECEASLIDLVDCQFENPCADVLDLFFSSDEPESPCPAVQEAVEASCEDFFETEDEENSNV